MANKTIIKPAKSPAAVGPYNHAVRVGDLLFCAGQIPIDPATGNLISGDIKAQTERVLQNVKAILDDQKLTFANVVKSTVFMTEPREFCRHERSLCEIFYGRFPGALDRPGRRAAQGRGRGNRGGGAFLNFDDEYGVRCSYPAFVSAESNLRSPRRLNASQIPK